LVCLACGLVTVTILGELRQWPKVVALALVMGGIQYGFAAAGLVPLSALGAGAAGLLAYWLGARVKNRIARGEKQETLRTQPAQQSTRSEHSAALVTIGTYGALTLLMAALTMVSPLRAWVQGTAWKSEFPAVTARTGFATPAGTGQVFRPLSHPGTLILLVSCLSIGATSFRRGAAWRVAEQAARATCRSALAATVGVISMVGLSTLMDHCGMSYLLAQGLSRLLGTYYPLGSPCVGILGAFATGSNNNSNVLFGSLQKHAALLLQLNPYLLAAAQTAGGSVGSMLAPVKIILGCSTVGQVGKEGQVLRQTVPCGLAIGLALGALIYVLSRFN
jgi:lactate permease